MNAYFDRNAEEVERLRRCINDLLSVVALPAVWSGDEPSQIVQAFLGALIGILDLDFAYLRLRQVDESSIQMLRVSQPRNLVPGTQVICDALEAQLGNDPQKWPRRIRSPIGHGDVSILPLALGLRGEIGVIVAGSERADFPEQTEALVLSVAANQAAIWLLDARVLSEQKRVARELDRMVEQRTKELAAANEELRALKDQLHNENIALREEIDEASMFEEIVGSSEGLRKVLSQVGKVASSDATVLILGETGTGKELIARAIHRHSRHAAHAFIAVNCGAIPVSLIASELFGHEKGAFTGALQRRLGRFESAQGGTIFLDEVGELPQEAQVALLRVLQEHEFEPVGGSRTIKSDVRVICATNRDLSAAIAAGEFRSDLFYRLNVFPIEIPPLRERREDIAILVEYFVQRFSRKVGKSIRRINQKTQQLLQCYRWPGNIRELQNVIERSVIVCDTEEFSIDESWLSQKPPPRPAGTLSLARADVRAAIESALAESAGRVSGPSGAARRLGIPGSTLDSKIRSLGIDKRRFIKS